MTELPTFVRIDASTLCQLNCPACYMRRTKSGTVGKGFLKYHAFKNFIDNHNFITHVELSNSGEIFINPELINIIEYAFQQNVKLTASNGVNFNHVSDEILESLVKYRFSNITISIDGASQAVYSLYRRNGDYNNVIRNISTLNKFKKRYNSEFPKLTWQYIIMEHNEDDIVNAKNQAKQLDMNIKFKLTWERNYKPKKIDMLRAETGLQFFNREQQSQANPTKISNYAHCHQLFKSPQINWDGRLLGCCCVYESDFGVNVFKEGLYQAINSECYQYAKKLVQGEVVPTYDLPLKNIPCITCTHYKRMVENNIFYKHLT